MIYLVPGAGIEPAQPQGPRDFKSLASTSSATQAQCSPLEETVRFILFLVWRVKDLMSINLHDLRKEFLFVS